RDVEDELPGSAGSDVSKHVLRRRLVARDVMIDDYLRNIEPANCIGERAQPFHVSDVDDNQEIYPLQCGRPLSRSIIYIRAQKKAKRLGPRSRVHDLYAHSARFE